MKENKFIIGILIGAGLMISLFFYSKCSSTGATNQQIENIVQEVIAPFQQSVDKQFYIQSLQIDTLKQNDKIIIDKVNEVIELQNKMYDTLIIINNKCNYLVYGNNAIYLKLTGKQINYLNH